MFSKILKLKKNIALLFGAMPFILILFFGFEYSISSYEYVKFPVFFHALVLIPSLFYAFDAYTSDRKYNYIMCLGLLMVVFFGYREQPILHYLGAVIYFLGNSFFAYKYATKKERIYILLFFGFGVISLILTKLFFPYLFLYSEIYMIVLSSIFAYLEITNKIT